MLNLRPPRTVLHKQKHGVFFGYWSKCLTYFSLRVSNYISIVRITRWFTTAYAYIFIRNKYFVKIFMFQKQLHFKSLPHTLTSRCLNLIFAKQTTKSIFSFKIFPKLKLNNKSSITNTRSRRNVKDWTESDSDGAGSESDGAGCWISQNHAESHIITLSSARLAVYEKLTRNLIGSELLNTELHQTDACLVFVIIIN